MQVVYNHDGPHDNYTQIAYSRDDPHNNHAQIAYKHDDPGNMRDSGKVGKFESRRARE